MNSKYKILGFTLLVVMAIALAFAVIEIDPTGMASIGWHDLTCVGWHDFASVGWVTTPG